MADTFVLLLCLVTAFSLSLCVHTHAHTLLGLRCCVLLPWCLGLRLGRGGDEEATPLRRLQFQPSPGSHLPPLTAGESSEPTVCFLIRKPGILYSHVPWVCSRYSINACCIRVAGQHRKHFVAWQRVPGIDGPPWAACGEPEGGSRSKRERLARPKVC